MPAATPGNPRGQITLTTVEEVREKLRSLDQELSSAGEDWASFRRRADEVIRTCMESAARTSEPDRTRFWLCALQASDLSKNAAISNLSFSGRLDGATYLLPAGIADGGGILGAAAGETQGSGTWRRTFVTDPAVTRPIALSNRPAPSAPDPQTEPANPREEADWQNLLAISFHLLGESLLIFCLDNIEPFLDGYRDDYAFREERLPSDYRLAVDPIIVPDFCERLPYPISDMQDMLDVFTYGGGDHEHLQQRFKVALGVLGVYFDVGNILNKLSEVGIDTQKRVLLLIPDKALNQVPIHLLYTFFRGPLYRQFAGFVYSWDLMSFKWRHYRRHVYYRRRLGRNKCVFFAVPGQQGGEGYLYGTAGELGALQRAFGDDNVVVFGDKGSREHRSTAESFVMHHRDAEWVVFSGHGIDLRMSAAFPGRQGAPSTQAARILVPVFGLSFEDRIVSSVEILASGCWNFARARLVLLNSCLLTRLAGPATTHGIRTALYAKGATSVLGSLWPVYEELCPVFMEEFTNAYRTCLERTESHALARSLDKALRGLESWTEQKYGVDLSIMYGGHILDGLP
jgi:hypothetical protein